ncbi:MULTISPECIES: hypothetical protein [Amycolatopsis]|uniref:Uncharacterized protein n=1 Tax=Amycolatopsis dongchuanensis TaxID=1070866 RepID=A0ABP9Q439_9PSEU
MQSSGPRSPLASQSGSGWAGGTGSGVTGGGGSGDEDGGGGEVVSGGVSVDGNGGGGSAGAVVCPMGTMGYGADVVTVVDRVITLVGSAGTT